MKSYDEYAKTAKRRRPFSNSTDWENFQYGNCLGGGNPARRCVNDDDENEGCPLIMLSLHGRTPTEWVGARYLDRCTEKTTPADARKQAAAAARAAVADMHYTMFEENE